MSILFSGSQILERSSRLPWKSKILLDSSLPADGFIFDPLAFANMKGPQLVKVNFVTSYRPNPKIDVPLLFGSFVQSLMFSPIFLRSSQNFANRKVSQLDFLMLLAAEHLEVTGVKSSTWEVRFRVEFVQSFMLESLGSLLLDCL